MKLMERRAGCMRRGRALACALTLLACGAVPDGSARAEGDVRLFRPLIADPRENQIHWRMVSFTEDWRYGTDIGDSTSRGGFEQDRRGVSWEVSGGETFRWQPLERLGGWRGPWIRYQLGLPAGMFADFDDTGSLLCTDYQFGLSFDALWSGAFDPDAGNQGFDRPAVSSRLSFLHRSSHLGDEYLVLSHFARNREGQGVLSVHPPVKREDLSFEALQGVVSAEWAPPWGAGRPSTLRAYGGGEVKVTFPARWKVGGLRPRSFNSPAARFGLELRSAANRPDPGALRPPGAQGPARELPVASEWFAAFDLRLARPFDFASCDNPTGMGEVWTPSLSTECPYGHEFARYAGSWHGMIGIALTRRARRALPLGGHLLGPEWRLALEWYRGYSPNGQFLDQRLRYRPRAYVLPSLSANF